MTGPLAVAPIIPALSNLALFGVVGFFSLLAAAAAILKPSFWKLAFALSWHQRRPLSVVITIVMIVWIFARAMVPSGDSEVSLRIEPVEWRMARGNLLRLGAADNSSGPTSFSITWQSRVGRDAFYGSPAVAGDRLYAIGSRRNQGRIYCFDRDSGQVIWDSAPPKFAATYSSPVLSHNRLFCGEGLHTTRNARLVCLDLEREGQVIWALPTKSHVECSPVVDWPYVYVSAGDDGVYCVDARKVVDGQPEVVWHLGGDKLPDAETALIVHKDRVFVGLGIGGNQLVVLDANTGSEVKRIPFPHPLFAPPAIQNGKLYVGMGVGDFVTKRLPPEGLVCCIDLSSLDVEWRCKLPGSVMGAVSATSRGLFCGCWDGRIYHISLSGKIKRSWDSGSPIVASLSVTQDAIYCINDRGQLSSVDRGSFAAVARRGLASPGLCWGAPVIDSGQMFVGTESQGLICIGTRQDDSGAVAHEWNGELGDVRSGGTYRTTSIGKRGRVAWVFPDGTKERPNNGPESPVAIAGHRILLSVAGGAKPGMTCITTRAAEPRELWHNKEPLGVTQSAVILRDRVIYVTGRLAEDGRELVCCSLLDGSVVWRRPVSGESQGAICGKGNLVFAQVGNDDLTAISLSNKILWSEKIGSWDRRLDFVGGMGVVAVDRPSRLITFDLQSGARLWDQPIEAATTIPTILDNQIVIGSNAGVRVRSLKDGKLVSRHPGKVVIGKHIIAGDDRVRFQVPVSGRFLFASPKGWLGFGRRKSQRWFELPESWGINAAMILDRGNLYLRVAGVGLVCLRERG